MGMKATIDIKPISEIPDGFIGEVMLFNGEENSKGAWRQFRCAVAWKSDGCFYVGRCATIEIINPTHFAIPPSDDMNGQQIAEVWHEVEPR